MNEFFEIINLANSISDKLDRMAINESIQNEQLKTLLNFYSWDTFRMAGELSHYVEILSVCEA